MTAASVLLSALLAYGLVAASLYVTRRIADGAYFRRGLAHGRIPWIAHAPSYGLVVYATMFCIAALTNFPYTLDAETFVGRNAYGIWSLLSVLAQMLAALSLFSVVGVPLLLWLFTQRVPERPTGKTRPRGGHKRRNGIRRRGAGVENRTSSTPQPPGSRHD